MGFFITQLLFINIKYFRERNPTSRGKANEMKSFLVLKTINSLCLKTTDYKQYIWSRGWLPLREPTQIKNI